MQVIGADIRLIAILAYHGLEKEDQVTDREGHDNEIFTVDVKLFSTWVLKVLVSSAASLFMTSCRMRESSVRWRYEMA